MNGRRSPIVQAVLVALFWIAQIQGIAHGISHLQTTQSYQDSAPATSIVCSDCASFSQAGAAPVSDFSSDLLVSPRTLPHVGIQIDSPALDVPAAFRSRAPPTASV